MADQDQRDLMDKAQFGIEVESFLDSRIGKYLTARAHLEVDEALSEFRKADPTDAKAITALQTRIHRGESFDNWLAEAIQEGWAAEEALRQS